MARFIVKFQHATYTEGRAPSKHILSALGLVVNMIVLWNTLYIGAFDETEKLYVSAMGDRQGVKGESSLYGDVWRKGN